MKNELKRRLVAMLMAVVVATFASGTSLSMRSAALKGEVTQGNNPKSNFKKVEVAALVQSSEIQIGEDIEQKLLEAKKKAEEEEAARLAEEQRQAEEAERRRQEEEEAARRVSSNRTNVPDSSLGYRLTSYYTGEDGTGSTTGSGLNTSQFGIDEHGWYTYNGKLVLAGATNACLNSRGGACGKWNEAMPGKHYFNYFEELTIVIDGVAYEAIVLDSCGASMYLEENRLDLFVSNTASAIDRGYGGNNLVQVAFKG